ncbi:acyl-CoA dehydrogenase family protein [Mycobacterium montefiorense]|uniref:Hydroxylase n=1 Tax=Mycobacterium montefiorense TaxID=154654 RepID=A0AA37UU39_9MYCO|nr:acyl-CoA dehydrogenase family protein [Mycobacterium montefiorense]GBG36816.1 hydroxylase [Mycobacterium montefiorense]GKU37722.1 hydroxylase [Mycobacterium montefiorense]GKU42681.1 hydroxylase [Mycobacterium montefiorense]GKU46444.1 hydroxylase [Mycobacterium montefiorense]GKU50973.1 hydroxylase [Mycobacterium montefiorense]
MTSATCSAASLSDGDPIAVARALVPEIARRADEAEALGTLPLDLVERLRAAGIFRAVQPRSLGGFEVPPVEYIQMIEELAHADGSTGWIAAIGGGAPTFSAWLEPTVATELFGSDADFLSATVFSPTGHAVPDGGGRFDIDGRWPFASGSRHAEWMLGGMFVFDDGTPRMLPEQGPDWRLAFFPRADAEIDDNWDVLGLRATGSNDVVARGLKVPEEHTISPFFQPARQDGPLWRIPFFTLVGIGMVGAPLGIARRALDEFAGLAPTKTRAGTVQLLAEDSAVQVEFARAEAGLASARAFVLDEANALTETACAGDPPSLQQRARFQLAAQQAMRAARQAVDTTFDLTGGSAVRAGHPLQRCFRDLHTASQHVYFSPSALKRYANTRFGIAQPTHLM